MIPCDYCMMHIVQTRYLHRDAMRKYNLIFRIVQGLNLRRIANVKRKKKKKKKLSKKIILHDSRILSCVVKETGVKEEAA